MEREPFDDMRDRAPHESEINSFGSAEPDRLNRRGNHPESSDRGAVGGEDHVASPLEDIDLVTERPRSAAEIGTGDDVEDCLAGCADPDGQWPEWSRGAADAGVERQRPSGDEPEPEPSDGGGGDRPTNSTHTVTLASIGGFRTGALNTDDDLDIAPRSVRWRTTMSGSECDAVRRLVER